MNCWFEANVFSMKCWKQILVNSFAPPPRYEMAAPFRGGRRLPVKQTFFPAFRKSIFFFKTHHINHDIL